MKGGGGYRGERLLMDSERGYRGERLLMDSEGGGGGAV